MVKETSRASDMVDDIVFRLADKSLSHKTIYQEGYEKGKEEYTTLFKEMSHYKNKSVELLCEIDKLKAELLQDVLKAINERIKINNNALKMSSNPTIMKPITEYTIQELGFIKAEISKLKGRESE